ncbi:unnamed protein product [Euphydryas editha]|uniref:Uncharacterized protein n=1 Tax=Euphydryas editha TaxID=104508 RepID=A0AAU9U341_EUPED|nr:unnamed protein product [Euphydryas editha]
MFRVIFLLTCLVLCKGHAVLPVIAPVVHAIPVSVLTPYNHHRYAELGFGHWYLGKAFGHHILKRSPRIVPIGKYDHIGAGVVGNIGAIGHAGAIGHLGGIASVASITPIEVQPAAISHQARVDVRTSPAVVAAPVVIKEVFTPVVAPYFSKPYRTLITGIMD